jgi:hypothetical protein
LDSFHPESNPNQVRLLPAEVKRIGIAQSRFCRNRSNTNNFRCKTKSWSQKLRRNSNLKKLEPDKCICIFKFDLQKASSCKSCSGWLSGYHSFLRCRQVSWVQSPVQATPTNSVKKRLLNLFSETEKITFSVYLQRRLADAQLWTNKSRCEPARLDKKQQTFRKYIV